jgi:ABC-type amino acid transport substrate-binding protein
MQKSKWSALLLLFLVTSSVFIIRRIQRSKLPAIPNKIIVGTSADYPPFSFKKDTSIEGMDIELIQLLMQKLNLPYEIQNIPFPLLFSKLQEGKVHLITGGISANTSRRGQATFTNAYVTQDPLVIITNQDSAITKPQDLGNKRVSVNTGYTADMYVSQMPNISILRTETISQSMEQLQAKEADAFLTNLNTVASIFDRYGAENYRAITIEDTDENIALAISPLYPDFAAQIQMTLDRFMRDGTIERLREKWHIQ